MYGIHPFINNISNNTDIYIGRPQSLESAFHEGPLLTTSNSLKTLYLHKIKKQKKSSITKSIKSDS